ncbi:hypothetical protein IAU60_006073 [Kwoniella sp. DSM 27419]
MEISLPTATVLHHLAPNPLLEYPEHPLVELPKLYSTLHAVSPISLLTSLTLDGMDGVVNDYAIISLKWCTHLTALWMKGCRVTDEGIRLLASALELPGEKPSVEGKGMWRLRSWSVAGCKGISDRSAKVFARWPGLVMLDIRDTSCTSAAIQVFNTMSHQLFSGSNANFQPCTDGLLKLFATNVPAATLLDSLRLSLLKSSSRTIHREDERNHIALHVTPSHRPIPPNWLPGDLPKTGVSRKDVRFERQYNDGSIYLPHGIGQIYVTGAAPSTDEESDSDRSFDTGEWWCSEPEDDTEDDTGSDRLSTSGSDESSDDASCQTIEENEAVELLKPISPDADARSKAFVKGATRVISTSQRLLSEDVREVMLVRMVNQRWDKLSWAKHGVSVEDQSLVMRGSQRIRGTNLVSELLDSTRALSSPRDLTQAPLRATFASSFTPSPFRPTAPGSPPFGSSSSQQRPLSNPFRTIPSHSNTSGIKPLPACWARDPLQSQAAPCEPKPKLPNTASTSSKTQALSAGTRLADDALSFAPRNKKRTFDGSGVTEGKRRDRKVHALGSKASQ